MTLTFTDFDGWWSHALVIAQEKGNLINRIPVAKGTSSICFLDTGFSRYFLIVWQGKIDSRERETMEGVSVEEARVS